MGRRGIGVDPFAHTGPLNLLNMEENRKLILVVDDDPDIRLLLTVSLKKAGFATLQASNGVKALDLLKGQIPNLIVTDARMPLLDGYGLVRAVKTQAEFRQIPILMLTGVDGEKMTDEDIQPDERMKKPFATAALLATIERLLLPT